jgi:pimeloyl-ACP methyl ester carboxylesterase
MAANTSEDAVNAIPDELFRRFLANVRPLKAQLRSGFPPFTSAAARAVRVPTLLVSGTKSPVPLRAVTTRLATLIPRAQHLTIDGATHNMFVSHPDEFNDGVLRFLASRGTVER